MYEFKDYIETFRVDIKIFFKKMKNFNYWWLGHIGSYFIQNINKIKNLKSIYVVDNFSGRDKMFLFFLKKPKTNKNIYFFVLIYQKKIH